jgi:hypothetical protein
MTAAIIAAVVIIVAVLAGLMSRKRDAIVQAKSAKPQKMTFPVTPSDGDKYARGEAAWVYGDKGWSQK